MNIEVGGFFGLLILIADVWAIVNVFGSRSSTGGKVLWTVLILLLPLVGFLIWLVAGPRDLEGLIKTAPEAPNRPTGWGGMPQRTALLFANVASRQGATDLAPAIEALRAGGVRILDRRPPDIRQLGAWIVEHRSDVDLVIVGGGDGTLNAAAEALLATGLPLGILPLGTANDLARTLGIPAISSAPPGSLPRSASIGSTSGGSTASISSMSPAWA